MNNQHAANRKGPRARSQLAADSMQLAAMILYTGYFSLPAASCSLLAESPVSPFHRVARQCTVPSRKSCPLADKGGAA